MVFKRCYRTLSSGKDNQFASAEGIQIMAQHATTT